MKKILIGVICTIAGSLALVACGTKTVVVRAAAAPTVTVAPSSAPAPQATVTVPAPQAPAAAAPSNYAQDIANAGIVAPLSWLTSTGDQLCADWQNGESTAQTDDLLLAGGIHPDHLALFDSITNSDVCPGVSP